MDAYSITALVGFIAASFLAAAPSSLFRPGEWYERLRKPSWRPPNRAFAPVWSVLYLTIAVSGWLVWQKVGFAGALLPFAVYALQLVLNAAWTPLFFGLRRPDLGLVDISDVASNRRNDCHLLSDSRRSRDAARALPRVGLLRRSAELLNLAP